MKNNEEGSILVSVVLFIYLSALLLTGIAYVVKNQVIQYQQIKQSYEVKSMLEFSEKYLEKELEERDEVTGGTLTYSNGVISINSLGSRAYDLSAELSNHYKLSKRVVFPEKEVEEEIEDSELNDGEIELGQESSQADEEAVEETTENPEPQTDKQDSAAQEEKNGAESEESTEEAEEKGDSEADTQGAEF